MKTTVDIEDHLLEQAKRLAHRTRRPLRSLIEEGLRKVLTESTQRPGYRLQDCSVGVAGADDPLERMTWQDLRDEIYGGR